MKKKYIILFAVIGFGIILGSCSDYLKSDYLFKDRMSTEDIFTSEDYSDDWLARAYSFLGEGQLADVSSKGHTPFSFADDMYFGDRDDMYKTWKNGEYNEDGVFGVGSNLWNKAYLGIRQASIYIENIDMNEDMPKKKVARTKAEARFLRAMFYWKLIRMFGPVPLLPEEGLDYTEDYDALARPRNTYDECVDFITSELSLAAKDLLLDSESNAIARPTIGAALALRARVYLYAASPLMNGGLLDYTTKIKDDQGKDLMPLTKDESKWAKAAAAARDVMELGGGTRYALYHFLARTGDNESLAYPKTLTPFDDGNFVNHDWPNGYKNIDPFESYRSLFNGTIGMGANPELIFTRGQNQSGEGINVMVVHQLPRVATGWNTHGLTLKQGDAYYMKDGTDAPGKDKEINRGDGSSRITGYVADHNENTGNPQVDDENKDKNKQELELYKPLSKGVSLQYANREPRFYASVAYNGSVWNLLKESKEEKKNKQVFYYRGADNGYTNTMFWLRTGIGVKKFVHPDDTYENNNIGNIRFKLEPSIRFAEVLLIYAEAMNELNQTYNVTSWDGAESYVLKPRDTDELKRGIQPIRIRAGVPDYSTTEYSDQTEFRKKLKRERQIELMGEGHRYYDLRRWLEAPVEESMPIYGYNALATAEQRDLFHMPIPVPSLPTTFSEKMWFWPINHTELKRNKRLTQNPGWTYPY